MARILSWAMVCVVASCGGGGSRPVGRPAVPEPTVMPAEMVEHRFYLQVKTAKGDPLRLYTDSGGGLFLLKSAADRLGLPAGETAKLEVIPPIPLPEGGLPIIEDKELGAEMDCDGMLGEAWFGGHVWTFDYPRGRLLLREAGDLPPHRDDQAIPIGLKEGLHFPRVQITVDGQPIEVLLDTGAMTTLTDGAVAALGGTAKVRATSFIVMDIFDGWHQRHPDWRLIDEADAVSNGQPMIEVPAVTIAGQTVGPVWFTRRPNDSFRKWMSQWMDQPVEGAFGGSGLKYLRVTVDYLTKVAIFERP